MRCLALFSLLASAAAFVVPSLPRSATRVSRAGALKMSVNDLVGADVETSGVWDPLGLSQDPESLAKYRAVELKHGRVAMLAIVGVLAQSQFHLPDPVFDNPRPLSALLQLYDQRPEALYQVFAGIGLLEFTLFRQKPENAPGDLEFGTAFKPNNAAELEALQLKELKNGRLAMFAILGELYQESLTGQGPLEQLSAGHISPFGDGQGFF